MSAKIKISKKLMIKILSRNKWNITKAAKRSGMSRVTFVKNLRKKKIEVPKRKCAIRHDDKHYDNVYDILLKNNFNLVRASKECNVSYQQIHRWVALMDRRGYNLPNYSEARGQVERAKVLRDFLRDVKPLLF